MIPFDHIAKIIDAVWDAKKESGNKLSKKCKGCNGQREQTEHRRGGSALVELWFRCSAKGLGLSWVEVPPRDRAHQKPMRTAKPAKPGDEMRAYFYSENATRYEDGKSQAIVSSMPVISASKGGFHQNAREVCRVKNANTFSDCHQ